MTIGTTIVLQNTPDYAKTFFNRNNLEGSVKTITLYTHTYTLQTYLDLCAYYTDCYVHMIIYLPTIPNNG